MNTTKSRCLFFLGLLSLLCFAAAPPSAMAHPDKGHGKHGKGHGHGHGKKWKKHKHESYHSEWWRNVTIITMDGRFHIPPGHRPPPGMCRLWIAGEPPGHQPPPVPCDRIRVVPGAFIVYGDYGYDPRYEWRYAREDIRRTVPHAVLDIILDQVYGRR